MEAKDYLMVLFMVFLTDKIMDIEDKFKKQ